MLIVQNKSPHTTPDLADLILDSLKGLQKKQITFELNSKLIECCRERLKAPEMEIYKVLYSLLNQKIIVPSSTLSRDVILEDPNRAFIYETIQNHPGIHIHELSALIGLNSSVIRSHLMLLEHFEYIRRKIYEPPKVILLFQKDFPETYDDFFLIRKNENDRRIIQLLLIRQLTLPKISSQLNLPQNVVKFHLQKLESLKVIIRITKDHFITYTFNPTRIDSYSSFLNALATLEE